MLAKVYSTSLVGLEAREIQIEVESNLGIPHHVMLGLPDAAVKESKQRIESAINNSGFEFPVDRKLTINLAPADIKKEGPVFDLPIALGALASFALIPPEAFQKVLILGELTLEGLVRPVRGVLAVCEFALKNDYKKIIIPFDNQNEVWFSKDQLAVYPVQTLKEAYEILVGAATPPQLTPQVFNNAAPSELNFKEVKGQAFAKRALEIAAAGFHNVLMVGVPGCGKTLLAKRFPSILPALNFQEALQVTKIYSVAGLFKPGQGLMQQRPFRSPHHTISNVGIAGGGALPKPGEVTLAHHGVLFLDELAEFDKRVLEVLRQPLEDGEITVSRALQSLTFPSQFILIAAMNPCPCGNLGHPLKACVCHPKQIDSYWKKLSGPMLDRIDLIVEMPHLKTYELLDQVASESSSEIQARVQQALVRQAQRYQNESYCYNGKISARGVQKHCALHGEAKDLMRHSIEKLNLSGRSFDRVLKVARTIADLEGCAQIEVPHVAEAMQYRKISFNKRGE
jgi:magnesium chelatase family protein